MGLMIHSLAELPIEARRRYYMYLLDYGWSEPVMDTILKNFPKLAEAASKNDAVVVRGTPGVHFADEVLSWHGVNGRPAENILPAILITTRHPQDFQLGMVREASEHRDALLLIPLRSVCKSQSDVIPFIEKLFEDIHSRKSLSQFQISEELSRGDRGAFVDALILRPSVKGVGVDLKELVKWFRATRKNN